MDESVIYSAIGTRIKDQRNKIGKTQAQLAKEIGVSRVSVTNIEGGKQNFPLHLVYAIADKLLTSPHELLPSPDEIGGSAKDTLDLMKELSEEEKRAIRNAVQEVADETNT